MATPGHSAPSPVTGSSPRLPAPSPSERGSRRRLRVARGPATRVEGSRPVASCGRRGARVGHATAAGREPPLPCGTSRGRGPRRPLAGVCPSPGAVSFPECHSGGIVRHAAPPCWLSSLSRFLTCARGFVAHVHPALGSVAGGWTAGCAPGLGDDRPRVQARCGRASRLL